MKVSYIFKRKKAKFFRRVNKENSILAVKALGVAAIVVLTSNAGMLRDDKDGFEEFKESQEAAKQKVYVCDIPEKDYGNYISRPVLRNITNIATSFTEEDIEVIARVISGIPSVFESDKKMASVAWMILNRVDNPEFPDTIKDVVINGNFESYDENNLIYKHIEEITIDVLVRWNDSKEGHDPERVLPEEYIDYKITRNGISFLDNNGKEWDWSIKSPYET